jgi:hypothetical protein
LWVRPLVCWRWGLGVAWSVRPGRQDLFLLPWFAVVGGVGGRWGSLPGLACQVWEGLSGLRVPEKIPQVGHDGDLLPGASLVFLTFLAAPVAVLQAVVQLQQAQARRWQRARAWLVCGCVLHLCVCWFRSAAPGVGLGQVRACRCPSGDPGLWGRWGECSRSGLSMFMGEPDPCGCGVGPRHSPGALRVHGCARGQCVGTGGGAVCGQG